MNTPSKDLNEDMRASDIVYVLQHASFHRGHCLIRLDPGVRDYLITALRRSHSPRPV